jgi:hypothetical protein
VSGLEDSGPDVAFQDSGGEGNSPFWSVEYMHRCPLLALNDACCCCSTLLPTFTCCISHGIRLIDLGLTTPDASVLLGRLFVLCVWCCWDLKQLCFACPTLSVMLYASVAV